MVDTFITNTDDFIVYSGILQFCGANIPANISLVLGFMAPTGYNFDFIPDRSFTITKLYYEIDNTDTSYTDWTLGTIQWELKVNNVSEHTSSAYTKTTYNNDASGTNTKIVTEDVSVVMAADDILECFVNTDSSWNSTGGEVGILVYGYFGSRKE